MNDKFEVPKGTIIKYGGCALQLTKKLQIDCEDMSVIIEDSKYYSSDLEEKENQSNSFNNKSRE